MSEQFNGWITKYVGEIKPARLEVDESSDYAYRLRADGRLDIMIGGFRIGRDVWRTEAEAVADAQRRIEKKIKSLEKQIAKLRKIRLPGESHP